MSWVFLLAAIGFEVFGTTSLRLGGDKKIWYVGAVVGYMLAFGFLSLTLQAGMPLGVAYGIWAASGVAIMACLSYFIFHEKFTWLMALGIALIIGGVLLIEIG